MEEEKKIEVVTSKQFTVNWRDITKGLLISAITSALLLLYPIINASRMPTGAEWKTIGLAALSACLSYVIKNFFTPAQTIVKTTPPVTEKEKQEIKEVIQDKQNEKKP